MASRKAEDWWQRHDWRRQGYPNEPVPASIPPGRTGEKMIRGVVAANIINANGERPEVYAPTASTYTATGRVPGHARTLRAEYYADSHILRVTDWGDSGPAYNYYDVDRDTWNEFCSTESPGKYINSTLNYHEYGVAFI